MEEEEEQVEKKEEAEEEEGVEEEAQVVSGIRASCSNFVLPSLIKTEWEYKSS